MKKPITILFLALFLASCSSEPSAQEKRNNFDKCVIETFAKKVEGETFVFIRDNREIFEDISKRECSFHLD